MPLKTREEGKKEDGGEWVEGKQEKGEEGWKAERARTGQKRTLMTQLGAGLNPKCVPQVGVYAPMADAGLWPQHSKPG